MDIYKPLPLWEQWAGCLCSSGPQWQLGTTQTGSWSCGQPWHSARVQAGVEDEYCHFLGYSEIWRAIYLKLNLKKNLNFPLHWDFLCAARVKCNFLFRVSLKKLSYLHYPFLFFMRLQKPFLLGSPPVAGTLMWSCTMASRGINKVLRAWGLIEYLLLCAFLSRQLICGANGFGAVAEHSSHRP